MRTIDVWDRIEAWLADNAPEILADLNPGADDEAFASFQDRTDRALPTPARESYRVHDGQLGGAAPLLGEWELLPLEDVVAKWELHNGVFEESEPDHSVVTTEDPIRQRWWSEEWIPVCTNGAGDFYCLDLAPATGGDEGQVISFWHMDPQRQVVASDFRTLLSAFADDLEAGKYRVEDGRLEPIEEE